MGLVGAGGTTGVARVVFTEAFIACAGAGTHTVSPVPSSCISHSLMCCWERSESTRNRKPACPSRPAQASSHVAWMGRNPSGTAKCRRSPRLSCTPGAVRTQAPLSLKSLIIPPETPKSTGICRASRFLRRWLRRSDGSAELRVEFKSHVPRSLLEPVTGALREALGSAVARRSTHRDCRHCTAICSHRCCRRTRCRKSSTLAGVSDLRMAFSTQIHYQPERFDLFL